MKSQKSSGRPKKRKLFMLRRVVGQSMQPTLMPECVVLATGWFSSVRPEHVVVVSHDGVEKIKRINKVRNGRIFVLGDNLRVSTDSRSFGWLPVEAVVAKVIWPRLK